VALEPGSVDVFRIRAYLFLVVGNLDQAIKLCQQTVALDPLRTSSYLGLGYLLYAAGGYDEARAAVQRALDLNPQAALAHAYLGKILIAEGKPQQALEEIEKEPIDWERLTDQAMAYHTFGREEDSNRVLNELIAKHGTDSAYQIAQVYAYRGEIDKSFAWLERAYEERDTGLTNVKLDPVLKTLHHGRDTPNFSRKCAFRLREPARSFREKIPQVNEQTAFQLPFLGPGGQGQKIELVGALRSCSARSEPSSGSAPRAARTWAVRTRLISLRRAA
jgi:tetratricopeptide (TPR) repeat protein